MRGASILFINELLVMKNLVTKKNIPIIFGVCAVLLAVLNFQWIRTFCYDNDLSCVSFRALLLPLVLGGLPISIVSYFLRDEIFQSWIKFIAWWVPVGSLLSIVALNSSGGFIGNFFPSQVFAFTIIAMSASLFAIKTWELRRASQGNPIKWWIKLPSFVATFTLSLALSYYAYGLFW